MKIKLIFWSFRLVHSDTGITFEQIGRHIIPLLKNVTKKMIVTIVVVLGFKAFLWVGFGCFYTYIYKFTSIHLIIEPHRWRNG